MVMNVLLVGLVFGMNPDRASADLDIQIDENGTATVKALLELPGTPSITHDVLTDYDQWPTLFPAGLRLATIRREPDRVVTDLYVQARVLPGELRLMIETREPRPGQLDAHFLAGDFQRYERTWRLSPAVNGTRTKAELDMLIQLKQWAPHWLVATLLRQDLEEHFRKLFAAVEWRTHSPTAH